MDAQGATQRAASPTTCCFCSVPSSVTKALYRISALKEKAFEVWLSHVEDAFRGAGMSALFRASAVRGDSLTDQQDLHASGKTHRSIDRLMSWLYTLNQPDADIHI